MKGDDGFTSTDLSLEFMFTPCVVGAPAKLGVIVTAPLDSNVNLLPELSVRVTDAGA